MNTKNKLELTKETVKNLRMRTGVRTGGDSRVFCMNTYENCPTHLGGGKAPPKNV